MSYIFRRNKTVLPWALGAAFFGGAVQLFGYWIRSRENQNIAYTDHFRKAVKVTKANAGVEYLFGKPLEIKVNERLDAGNKEYFMRLLLR